jgi:hypothetical protein
MNWRRVVPRYALPALLALAMLAAPAYAAEPASSGHKLSPDERLDAIRHSLVQAALEGSTRVESVAWLDTEGRLQESSSFRSGMQVRGVQVLAYLRDAEGEPRARLRLGTAEPQLNLAKTAAFASRETPARRDLYKESTLVKAAPACAPSQGLRHLIGLELVVGERWPAQDAPMAHALAETIHTAWLQAEPQARPANWRMLADDDGVIKMAHHPSRSVYEKALLDSGNPPLPWLASIQVLPAPPLAAPQSRIFLQPLIGPPIAVPKTRISLSLSHKSMTGRRSSRDPLFLTADLPLLREPSQWGAPQFSREGRAQVQALLARWSLAVSEYLACDAAQPEVLSAANGTLRLSAGALAGVQPGEEWLLADPATFPERLLAPGIAQQLVLAKVGQVHALHAELQLLAGPARPVQPGWRAWRAELPLSNEHAQP